VPVRGDRAIGCRAKGGVEVGDQVWPISLTGCRAGHVVAHPRRGMLAGLGGFGSLGGADERRRRGDVVRLAPRELGAIPPLVVEPDPVPDDHGRHLAPPRRGLRDAAAPARRRVRNARRTEASTPGSVRSRCRTSVQSIRRRSACAAWQSDSPSAHGKSVASASRHGGQAGCPWVGNSARKASSVNHGSHASASRRSRGPLGNAARATRAVS
jgi:hypothetical protein